MMRALIVVAGLVAARDFARVVAVEPQNENARAPGARQGAAARSGRMTRALIVVAGLVAARDFARVLAVEPDNEEARAGLAHAQEQQRGAAE